MREWEGKKEKLREDTYEEHWVLTQQTIEKTGFSHVRPSNKGDISRIFFQNFCHFLHVSSCDLI